MFGMQSQSFGSPGTQGLGGLSTVNQMMMQAQLEMLVQLYMMAAFQSIIQSLFGGMSGAQGGHAGCGCSNGGMPGGSSSGGASPGASNPGTSSSVNGPVGQGTRDPNLIAQGNFGNVSLPGGKSVAGVGCMATSFIMCANGLNGTNLQPDQNTINQMNRGGGFQGNLIVRGGAASSLNMRQETTGNAQNLVNHLRNGGMAVIPVKGEGHWVSLRMGANGQIEALDPAGGVKRGVRIQGNQVLVDGYSAGSQDYIKLSPA